MQPLALADKLIKIIRERGWKHPTTCLFANAFRQSIYNSILAQRAL